MTSSWKAGVLKSMTEVRLVGVAEMYSFFGHLSRSWACRWVARCSSCLAQHGDRKDRHLDFLDAFDGGALAPVIVVEGMHHGLEADVARQRARLGPVGGKQIGDADARNRTRSTASFSRCRRYRRRPTYGLAMPS